MARLNLGGSKKPIGTALVNDVVAPKTFTTPDGFGLIGTAIDHRGQVVATIADNGDGDTVINVDVPEGLYDNAAYLTVDVANLLANNINTGITILGVNGEFTADATAIALDVLLSKTVYINGTKVTGTMANNGAVSITPSTTSQVVALGYHNGAGSVLGDVDLISANIKAGKNIFGIAGDSNVVNTSTGTAVAGEILDGEVAYVDGTEVTGTMTNISGDQAATAVNGSVGSGLIYLKNTQGYWDGNKYTYAQDSDFVATNIKDGKNIFGMVGSLTTEVTGSTASTALVATGKTIAANDLYEYTGDGICKSTSLADVWTDQVEGSLGLSYSTYQDFTMLTSTLGVIVYRDSSGYEACIPIRFKNGRIGEFGTKVSIGTNLNGSYTYIVALDSSRVAVVFAGSSKWQVVTLSISWNSVTVGNIIALTEEPVLGGCIVKVSTNMFAILIGDGNDGDDAHVGLFETNSGGTTTTKIAVQETSTSAWRDDSSFIQLSSTRWIAFNENINRFFAYNFSAGTIVTTAVNCAVPADSESHYNTGGLAGMIRVDDTHFILAGQYAISTSSYEGLCVFAYDGTSTFTAVTKWSDFGLSRGTGTKVTSVGKLDTGNYFMTYIPSLEYNPDSKFRVGVFIFSVHATTYAVTEVENFRAYTVKEPYLMAQNIGNIIYLCGMGDSADYDGWLASLRIVPKSEGICLESGSAGDTVDVIEWD